MKTFQKVMCVIGLIGCVIGIIASIIHMSLAGIIGCAIAAAYLTFTLIRG